MEPPHACPGYVARNAVSVAAAERVSLPRGSKALPERERRQFCMSHSLADVGFVTGDPRGRRCA